MGAQRQAACYEEEDFLIGLRRALKLSALELRPLTKISGCPWSISESRRPTSAVRNLGRLRGSWYTSAGLRVPQDRFLTFNWERAARVGDGSGGMAFAVK